jgi:hypothetical protein
MNHDSFDKVLSIIFCFVILGLTCFFAGATYKRETIKNQLTEQNIGKYIVDSTTGKLSFVLIGRDGKEVEMK